ncbi:hypothetical protein SAMN05421664_0824 [Chryseobacterium soldanellicola]|uniref:Uncharacterized protein n=1 Tax=Chryseobacterium soldanellicola TaxID=311333 RepID=A0A1H0YMR4_9FLAO|nr:hypothetical protein SAMN05421664_0824 [Chryseobacterium soldanellicola]
MYLIFKLKNKKIIAVKVISNMDIISPLLISSFVFLEKY